MTNQIRAWGVCPRALRRAAPVAPDRTDAPHDHARDDEAAR